MFCVSVLAPVLVPTNVGDIPSHLPVIDDYVNTVPGNTNFPGLLDSSSSTSGVCLLHTGCRHVVGCLLCNVLINYKQYCYCF